MKIFYKKLLETFEKEVVKDMYRTKGLTPVQFVDIYETFAGQEIRNSYLNI